MLRIHVAQEKSGNGVSNVARIEKRAAEDSVFWEKSDRHGVYETFIPSFAASTLLIRKSRTDSLGVRKLLLLPVDPASSVFL